MTRQAALSTTTGEEVFLRDPPHPGPYAPGDLICQKYRLVEPIGFGGMGAVWRAHNEVLDVEVALKLIRSDARLARCSERLLIEARVAAGIRHASVVRVFDYGKTHHDDPFIVMELLRGESLRDLLDRRRQMSPIEAVRTLLPILGGIACAHGRGIIHRDLKPENIFLAKDDAGGIDPKVLDFGIAKLEGDVSHLTMRGMLLGSPEYMAPEQAMGDQEVDHRIDIWAVAVVLYEMIAGRAPWESPNCPALLRAIVDDAPPKLTVSNGVDARLWAIIERGLAKNRDRRWTSARTFGRALAGWLASRSVVADVSGASLRAIWLDSLSPSAETGPTHVRSFSLDEGYTVARDEPPVAKRESTWRVIRWSGRPTRLTLGLTASLVLCGVGYHSSSSPAASVQAPKDPEPSFSVDAIASRDIYLDEGLDGGAISAAPAPSGTTALVEPVRPQRARRPRPFSAKPIPSASSFVAKGSARSMDFGF